MSPTEIIEKRLRDTASTNLTERNFFEQKFREFKQHLETENDSTWQTIKSKLRTVASFFSRNGLPLNLKRGDWESTLPQKVKHRFRLTKEELKKMYAHASLRDRALLLVLAQSGFSEIDVSMLRIEDLKGLYDMPQSEHYFIEKPREKTNIMQATCISYEALHDLRALIEERQEKEGYIFISQTVDSKTPIERRRINSAMKKLAVKALGKERAKDFKTKELRNFYNSALLNTKPPLTQEIKDLLMGHGRASARKFYSYTPETIMEAYNSAFSNLSINGIQTREDIAKFKQQTNNLIAEQQREMAQMKEDHEKAIEKLTLNILELKIELVREIAKLKKTDFGIEDTEDNTQQ